MEQENLDWKKNWNSDYIFIFYYYDIGTKFLPTTVISMLSDYIFFSCQYLKKKYSNLKFQMLNKNLDLINLSVQAKRALF
jgi:hypothetical protein